MMRITTTVVQPACMVQPVITALQAMHPGAGSAFGRSASSHACSKT
jgi:hypothetical protein